MSTFFLIFYLIYTLLAGTLLRKLEGGLRGISHVIVDEIHERDINVSIWFVRICSLNEYVVSGHPWVLAHCLLWFDSSLAVNWLMKALMKRVKSYQCFLHTHQRQMINFFLLLTEMFYWLQYASSSFMFRINNIHLIRFSI